MINFQVFGKSFLDALLIRNKIKIAVILWWLPVSKPRSSYLFEPSLLVLFKMKIFQFIVKICVQEIKMVDLIDKSITKWDFNGWRECVKRFHRRILPESVEETFLVSCFLKESRKSRCQFRVLLASFNHENIGFFP